VLVFYFFSQVTSLAASGGVNDVDIPGMLGNPGNDPTRLYFVTLAVAVSCVPGAAVRIADAVRPGAPGAA
jgi:hypothetical protein